MPQSIISIRMDDTLKNNFDYVCNELGLNMSTAITIFAKKVCREERIPFELSIDAEHNNERLKATRYYVYIYPESTESAVSAKKACFDNPDDSYNFLKSNLPEVQNEINDESGFYKHLALFYIGITTNEFFNPNSKDSEQFNFEHVIGHTEFGLIHRHKGVDRDISILENLDKDECELIYGYLKSLQAMQIIN